MSAGNRSTALLISAIVLGAAGIAAIIVGAINVGDSDFDDDDDYESSTSFSSSSFSVTSSSSSSSDDSSPCQLIEPLLVSLPLWLLIGGIAIVLWSIVVFIRYCMDSDSYYLRAIQNLFFAFLALPWLIIGTVLLIQPRVDACAGSALLIVSIIFLILEYLAVVLVLSGWLEHSPVDLPMGNGAGYTQMAENAAQYRAQPVGKQFKY